VRIDAEDLVLVFLLVSELCQDLWEGRRCWLIEVGVPGVDLGSSGALGCSAFDPGVLFLWLNPGEGSLTVVIVVECCHVGESPDGPCFAGYWYRIFIDAAIVDRRGYTFF
ncbi:hypothetical protein Dimus_037466, partial [Dionaea muscipula]